MTVHLARPPKTYPALMVELSPTMRAVVYGSGHTMLIRGDHAFTVSDLEAAKLEAARALFLQPQGVPQ